MTIDATIAGTSSDSFTTLAEANTYHGNRLHSEEWTDDASVPEKEKALKWATSILDRVEWLGRQWDENQALRWPRIEVPDREGSYWDYNEIPKWLKDATAELAWLLLISDPTREADTKGFHMIKVGPITLQIAHSDRSLTIYRAVMEIISPFMTTGIRMERG